MRNPEIQACERFRGGGWEGRWLRAPSSSSGFQWSWASLRNTSVPCLSNIWPNIFRNIAKNFDCQWSQNILQNIVHTNLVLSKYQWPVQYVNICKTSSVVTISKIYQILWDKKNIVLWEISSRQLKPSQFQCAFIKKRYKDGLSYGLAGVKC